MRMGMNKSVLASRMKGETAFLAVEIEAIAGLLKRDAADLFGAYIATGPDSTAPETNRPQSDYKSAGAPVAFMADFRARTAGGMS